MNYQTFKYSAKVWLCSVFAAPAIYFIGAYFHQPVKIESLSAFFAPYALFAFFEMLCSAATCLVFWFIAGLVVWIIEGNGLRKFLLSVSGIALTIITFRVFSSVMSFPLSGNSLILMAINCGCVGTTCWCFRPEPRLARSRVNPYMYSSEIPADPVNINQTAS